MTKRQSVLNKEGKEMKKETVFSYINDEITRRIEEGEPLDSREIAGSVPVGLVDIETLAFYHVLHYTRAILNIRGCKSIGDGIFFDIDTGTLGEQIDQLSMTDLSEKLIERGEKYKTIGELIGFIEKLA